MIYQLDGFLGYPALVQVLVVVGLTVLLVGAWALALRLALPHDADARGSAAALWWSVTHFMDGGTMAGDTGGERRWIALGATASGVLAISFLTGAFASKMAERINDLRSGRSPVVERGHLLLLGFDAKVALIALEVARSRQRATLVVLSQDDKERVEYALRPARALAGRRLRVVVRTGDPRSELSLLRVAAHAARAIVVVPPAALDDDAAVHWTLSTLLAVRRVVGPRFAGEVVVEARHAEAREMLMLAAEPGVAGPGALATLVVASDEVVARMLAQSARQDGVYFALREMLSFAGCELFLDPVPDALLGLRFDEAHAAVHGAILVGVRLASGRTVLDPSPSDARTLARADRLILLASNSRRYRTDGALPAGAPGARGVSEPPAGVERVVVVGYNRTLPYLVGELDKILAHGSEVRLLCAGGESVTSAQIAALRGRLARVKPVLDPRRTMELALAGDDTLLGADAVVILGCEDEADENGDASALASLLWLRHGMRRAPRRIRRVVTEVRDPRSAGHVTGRADDFLVSSDVVAMLMAQCALDPDVSPVYRELLSPEGVEVFLRPPSLYVAESGGTFADVLAAARLRGEVAIGLFPRDIAATRASTRSRMEEGETAEDEPAPIRLNPRRDTPVDCDPGTLVVVLAPSGLPFHAAEP